jgi:hypothetical protein
MKSSGKVDIAKLRHLPWPCHEALSWLPFSCYLVAGRMAKVESNNLSVPRRPNGFIHLGKHDRFFLGNDRIWRAKGILKLTGS